MVRNGLMVSLWLILPSSACGGLRQTVRASFAWRTHLAQSSPCINSGTNEYWMNLDLDGRSRIDRFSGMVDMGCYEYLPAGIMFSVP